MATKKINSPQRTTNTPKKASTRPSRTSETQPTVRVELPLGPTGLVFEGRPPRITHIDNNVHTRDDDDTNTPTSPPVPLSVGQIVRGFELKDCWNETNFDAAQLTTMMDACQDEARILIVQQQQQQSTKAVKSSKKRSVLSKQPQSKTTTAPITLQPPAKRARTSPRKASTVSRNTRTPAVVSLVPQAALLESQKDRLARFQREFPPHQQDHVRQICMGFAAPNKRRHNNDDDVQLQQQKLSSILHHETITTTTEDAESLTTHGDDSQQLVHTGGAQQNDDITHTQEPLESSLQPDESTTIEGALHHNTAKQDSNHVNDDEEVSEASKVDEPVPVQHVTTTVTNKHDKSHTSEHEKASTQFATESSDPASNTSPSRSATQWLSMMWDEMSLHCSTDQIHKTTLGVLTRLSNEAESWTLVDLDDHFAEILSAMKRFPNDSDIQDMASQIILKGAESATKDVPPETSSRESVRVILKILKAVPPQLNLQCGLMDTLFNQCQKQSDDVSSVILDNGGIEICLDAMKKFHSDSTMEEVACSLIFTLIKSKPDCTHILWEKNGIETILAGAMTDEAQQLLDTILQSMQTTLGETTIFADILQSGILTQAIEKSPSLCDNIVSCGGIESCIEIMNESAASKHAHEQACLFLKLLATNETSFIQRIKEKNGLQALSHLLWLYDGEDIAAEALAVLNILIAKKADVAGGS